MVASIERLAILRHGLFFAERGLHRRSKRMASVSSASGGSRTGTSDFSYGDLMKTQRFILVRRREQALA
jgi:hypothetical protein